MKGRPTLQFTTLHATLNFWVSKRAYRRMWCEVRRKGRPLHGTERRKNAPEFGWGPNITGLPPGWRRAIGIASSNWTQNSATGEFFLRRCCCGGIVTSCPSRGTSCLAAACRAGASSNPGAFPYVFPWVPSFGSPFPSLDSPRVKFWTVSVRSAGQLFFLRTFFTQMNFLLLDCVPLVPSFGSLFPPWVPLHPLVETTVKYQFGQTIGFYFFRTSLHRDLYFYYPVWWGF